MTKKVSGFQVKFSHINTDCFKAEYKLFIWGDSIVKPMELLIGQISFNQFFDFKKNPEIPILAISLTNYYIIFERRLVCYKKSYLRDYFKVKFYFFYIFPFEIGKAD
jgi:hypothetical protein